MAAPAVSESRRLALSLNHQSKGRIMGAGDKASNKIDNVGGKAKEALGKVTGDKSTEDRGKADQSKSSLKDAGEKIKDAFKK
jgi:uncharacterized protein YjbJ (UPF0337 family)